MSATDAVLTMFPNADLAPMVGAIRIPWSADDGSDIILYVSDENGCAIDPQKAVMIGLYRMNGTEMCEEPFQEAHISGPWWLDELLNTLDELTGGTPDTDDFTDPQYVTGAVLAQVEDLSTADRVRVLTDALEQVQEGEIR